MEIIGLELHKRETQLSHEWKPRVPPNQPASGLVLIAKRAVRLV